MAPLVAKRAVACQRLAGGSNSDLALELIHVRAVNRQFQSFHHTQSTPSWMACCAHVREPGRPHGRDFSEVPHLLIHWHFGGLQSLPSVGQREVMCNVTWRRRDVSRRPHPTLLAALVEPRSPKTLWSFGKPKGHLASWLSCHRVHLPNFANCAR